jgi:hypothetical protein
MEQISISGRDRQSTSNHYGIANFLNVLNLPAPSRGTMMMVTGNGVLGAASQGRVALLPGLEVARVNRE